MKPPRRARQKTPGQDTAGHRSGQTLHSIPQLIAARLSDARRRAHRIFDELAGGRPLVYHPHRSASASNTEGQHALRLDAECHRSQACHRESPQKPGSAGRIRTALQYRELGDWILRPGAVVWSDNLYRLHGFAPGEVATSAERCLEMLHPNDREHAGMLLAQSLDYGNPGTRVSLRHPRWNRPPFPNAASSRFFADSGEPAPHRREHAGRHRAQELGTGRIQKSEALLRRAEQLANLGSWQWD